MEEWRKKRYYDPRIIIDIDDVLENPFPLVIACFTGDEVCILRNLMAYAHRRSTFASEYFSDYYLAPTNEEWDVLESIVAGIEDKLMSNCEDLISRLDALIELAGTQCTGGAIFETVYAGDLVKVPGWGTLDDYPYTIEYGEGDPPPPYESWEQWHDDLCKWAQWLVDSEVEFVENIATIVGSYGHISESVLAGIMIATGIAIPISIATLLLGAIAVEVSHLGIEYLASWMEYHKQELVCAIYNAGNGYAATIALHEYIDENAAFPFSAYLKLIFNRSNVTAWYDGNHIEIPPEYSADYCLACGEMTIDEQHTWYFPPCPNGWTGAGVGCCEDGRIRVPQQASNWQVNVAPSYYQDAGDIALHWSAWVFFDFSKWDFPPQEDDNVFSFSLKRTSDGAVVSSRFVKASEVYSPGWTFIEKEDDSTTIVAGTHRMAMAHENTNALCTGVKVAAAGYTVTYN